MNNEIIETRKAGSEMASEIADKIQSLFDLMNDNYNFQESFDVENTDGQFPIYDFELRQHYDTYRMLSKRLLIPYKDGDDDGE